jgi:broad specificity phosphatase PhoE
MAPTTVHVVRHGQVHNPDGILYGRQPGFGLSDLGRQMAERVGEYFADVPLDLLRSSPLQRAQETMAPIAARHPHLEVEIDPRVIEAANIFEGSRFGVDNKVLFRPSSWWHFRNPLRPSWGEPYPLIARRMIDAITDAAASVPEGGQALIVSHQLPIFIARRAAQGRSFVHDPRRRETHLASVTSFAFDDGRIVGVEYAQPAEDLAPHTSHRKFRVGT